MRARGHVQGRDNEGREYQGHSVAHRDVYSAEGGCGHCLWRKRGQANEPSVKREIDKKENQASARIRGANLWMVIH
jgi:hypothetical protein